MIVMQLRRLVLIVRWLLLVLVILEMLSVASGVDVVVGGAVEL